MSEKVGETDRPIPDDWQIASLKSVSLNRAKNGFFKKPELVGAGYKLVNVSELYQPFGIDTRLESVERVTAVAGQLNHHVLGVSGSAVEFEHELALTKSVRDLCGLEGDVNLPLNLHVHSSGPCLPRAR